MPSASIAPPAETIPPTESAPPARISVLALTGAQKGAETRARHAAQRRADLLDHMHEQIEDGTLVVRHMTRAQHSAAALTARRIKAGETGAIAGERV